MQGVGTKGHEKVSPWEFKDQLGGLWSTPGRVIGDIIAFGPRVLFLEWTYLSLIFSSIFLGGGISVSFTLLISLSLRHIIFMLSTLVVFCGFSFLHQHFQRLEQPSSGRFLFIYVWVKALNSPGSGCYWIITTLLTAFPSWPHNLQPSTSTNEKQTDNAFQTLCLYLHFNSDLSFVSTTSPKFTMTFKLKILSV